MTRAGREILSSKELQAREQEFFDRVASERKMNTHSPITPQTDFAHLTHSGSEFIKRFLGNLEGKRVLDIGCGSGHSTVILAKRGARVTAIDLSEKYIEMARERIEYGKVEDHIEWIGKMGAEKLEFPDASFDAVFGGHILHHTRLQESVPEAARVLKPGSPAVFVETLGTNPFFNWVRNHIAGRFGIPKLSNETEYPLRNKELKFIASHFQDYSLRGDLCFSMLIGYVFRGKRITRFLRGIDDRMFELAPFLSKTAYAGILTLRK